MNAYDVIKKPVTSEKSYEGIRMKKYGFLVDVLSLIHISEPTRR